MLTQKDINRFRWQKDTKPRIDDNLYIRVRKYSKTYLYRKTVNKKTQFITLGKHPNLKLRDAKRLAAELSKQIITDTTVHQLITKFWNDVIEPSSKVPNQVQGYLNFIGREIGSRKVVDSSRAMLVSIIQNYSFNRGARSADRLRSYLKKLFEYGVELGIVEYSPMDGVTKRVTGYIAINRTRVLSTAEINDLWKWKNNQKGWMRTEDNVKVLKFLLLTGLRISEAQKGYIDGDKFRIHDTKGKHSRHEKRPHWVYLTPTAKSLLPLPKCTATNIQSWLKRKLIKEGVEPRYTPHDLRRTFATFANEQGVNPYVVEKCLNHKLEGVMGVYNHAEHELERIECYLILERFIINNCITQKQSSINNTHCKNSL